MSITRCWGPTAGNSVEAWICGSVVGATWVVMAAPTSVTTAGPTSASSGGLALASSVRSAKVGALSASSTSPAIGVAGRPNPGAVMMPPF